MTLSRYESGARTPKPEDVAQILTTLGVRGARYHELVEMARDADQPNWVSGPTGARRELTTLIEFETSARHITDVCTDVMPGLLQTADYAAAVMGNQSDADTNARVTMRVGRQNILYRANAPTLEVIITEHTLREPLGGYDVLLEQLRHLAKMSELDNVTIRAIPDGSTRWTPAHAGSFVLFEFAKAAPIVHLEHVASSTSVYSARETRAYQQAATTLRQIAMPPAQSAELINNIANELERKR
ncbi:XRE family transcriptional regulator [Actinopolyspora erythraea]|uniref:XRE family transcriptional regulator n=1 Tax=Actinopolyspora erythraea TaxID=414996 RepID=A0A223RVY8_9ACTN|nr:XRE family transcriptional regulator [Actinopolyspora erythraea]